MKRYCVRFYAPLFSSSNSSGIYDDYVTLEYDSRIARLCGWGIDYPGRQDQLDFFIRETKEAN